MTWFKACDCDHFPCVHNPEVIPKEKTRATGGVGAWSGVAFVMASLLACLILFFYEVF